jgi:hypothetical protein
MNDWKFSEPSARYHAMMKEIVAMNIPALDLIHHNPIFAGHANISRFLALYDIYKRTLGINGHIAEVGVWKGASFFLLAKLCEIFEPHSYTEVRGFDWFKGMAVEAIDHGIKDGAYATSEAQVRKMIDLQNLGHVAKLVNLDVTKDLPAYFEQNRERYRLVVLDAGTYQCVKAAAPAFWKQLTPGGIMVFDQYNDPRTPGETLAVAETLPDATIETFPWTRTPTAFAVKNRN